MCKLVLLVFLVCGDRDPENGQCFIYCIIIQYTVKPNLLVVQCAAF